MKYFLKNYINEHKIIFDYLYSEYDSEKIKHLEKIIKQHENNIEQLKTCNSDYYNQINTLSSKLALINNYISNSNHELSVDSYYKFKDLLEFDEIKKIIFDKTIKLGSDKE